MLVATPAAPAPWGRGGDGGAGGAESWQGPCATTHGTEPPLGPHGHAGSLRLCQGAEAGAGAALGSAGRTGIPRKSRLCRGAHGGQGDEEPPVAALPVVPGTARWPRTAPVLARRGVARQLCAMFPRAPHVPCHTHCTTCAMCYHTSPTTPWPRPPAARGGADVSVWGSSSAGTRGPPCTPPSPFEPQNPPKSPPNPPPGPVRSAAAPQGLNADPHTHQWGASGEPQLANEKRQRGDQ